jgi:hypothetical protein
VNSIRLPGHTGSNPALRRQTHSSALQPNLIHQVLYASR